ncbi:hypothetical protein IPV10_03610 [Microbacterium sp. SD291]|nr:hypothetical protein [Microbacterium sp. SD291]
MRQDFAALGRLVMRELLIANDDGESDQRELIQPEFVVCSSTAALRG